MAIAKDPRYDILFCDTDSSGASNKTLGLVLRESGGGVDFGMQAVSPYANRITQGDLQDSDFSRGTVRTQRDWTGGFGKLFTYQETDSFLEGTADSRFKNQIVLSPKIRKSRFYTSSSPEYIGEGTTNTTTKIQSQWTKRTSVAAESFAKWEDAGKVEKTWAVTDDVSAVGQETALINGSLNNPPSYYGNYSVDFARNPVGDSYTNIQLAPQVTPSGHEFFFTEFFGTANQSQTIPTENAAIPATADWIAFSSPAIYFYRLLGAGIFITMQLSVWSEDGSIHIGSATFTRNFEGIIDLPAGWVNLFTAYPLSFTLDKNKSYIVRKYVQISSTLATPTIRLQLDANNRPPTKYSISGGADVFPESVVGGTYIKWKYKNTTSSSVTISRVFIDMQGDGTSGTIRYCGGVNEIGPEGQSATWTVIKNSVAGRYWVDISVPTGTSSQIVPVNGEYWFMVSVVASNVATNNACSLSLYANEETGKSYFLQDYTKYGASVVNSGASRQVNNLAINFQINTLNANTDPDTRNGKYITWKTEISNATVNSVSIRASRSEYIAPGNEVYLCVSKDPIRYENGSIYPSTSVKKTQFVPTETAQWHQVSFSDPLVYGSTVASIYFAVISVATTSQGKTSLLVHGSELEDKQTMVFTVVGYSSVGVAQSGIPYYVINTGASSGYAQWTNKKYVEQSVQGRYTFAAAINRNHTLRLKMRVATINQNSPLPVWTLNASLKISIMDGTTEFASKTFSYLNAFTNDDNDDDPFSTSEKWVAIDFGSKSSSAKTYTIKVTPIAISSESEKISVFVYTDNGSYESIASSFSSSKTTTTISYSKLFYSFFSTNELPTTDTSISSVLRPSVYYHEYYGTDRRIAWTIKSQNEPNWVLNSIRFHARMIKWEGASTVTMKLYANANSAPSTVLREIKISKELLGGVADKAGWVSIPITANGVSSPYTVVVASTILWVSLECDTPNVEDKIEIDITCGKNVLYSTALSSALDGMPFEAWSIDGLKSSTVRSYTAATKTVITIQSHSFAVGMQVRFGSSSDSYTVSAVGNSGMAFSLSAAPSPVPTTNMSITEVINYDPVWVLNEGSGALSAIERPPIVFKGNWYCFGGNQLYVLNSSSSNLSPGLVVSYTGSTVTLSPNPFSVGMYVVIGSNVKKITARTSSTITLDSAVSPVPVAGDLVAGCAVWDPSTATAQTIQCAAQLGEYLYLGFGMNATCIKGTLTNGAWAWTNVSDNGAAVYGNYMRQHLGYLYISKPSGGVDSLRATNGDRWDKITVGTGDIEVTALASLGANLIVLSKTKMFEISSTFASHMYNYEIEANTNNGRGTIQWVADGKLYIPIKNGLNAFDGVRMMPIGPEQGYGLPVGMQGSVSCISGTKDFLFVSIDAGTNGYSSVLAFNGKGWHIIYKSPVLGGRIKAIGMEAIVDSRPRLWIFEGIQANYITFPSLTDNPYQYVGAEYDSDDYMISSWFGGELSAVLKDMQSVFVKADGCTQACKIILDLEADNSGVWCRIGEMTESPNVEFDFEIPGMSAKTIKSFNQTGAVKRIEINETLGDVSVGEFVSINEEVRQVKVVNGRWIDLSAPLTKNPGVGDFVLPSRPVGKEFRYKVTLVSNNQSLTPKLVRISFRMQEYTLSRFRFSMSAVIDDDVLLRTGGVEKRVQAADYRTEVYSWMKRTTPFTMVTPDGKNWRVKIMSGSESSWTRKEIGQNNQRFASVIQLQLDEV